MLGEDVKSLYPALLRGAALEQLPLRKGGNNVAKGFLCAFTFFANFDRCFFVFLFIFDLRLLDMIVYVL